MGNAINPERMAGRLRLVEEHLRGFNRHDLDALLGTFGSDAALILNGERHPGRDGIRALFGMLYGDFPDLHIRAQHTHLAGDTIIAEGALHATLSSRRLEIPLCALFHFDRDEKLADASFYFDGALLLRQLGRLPAAA
jgi:hypothetical protein